MGASKNANNLATKTSKQKVHIGAKKGVTNHVPVR